MENVAPDVTPVEPIQQGQWVSLLLDLIRRVEELETSRPARAVEPQQCEKIAFPISVKQVIIYSPTFWSNPIYPFPSYFFCSISFMCMNSPVPVIIRCSALFGGKKWENHQRHLKHFSCT